MYLASSQSLYSQVSMLQHTEVAVERSLIKVVSLMASSNGALKDWSLGCHEAPCCTSALTFGPISS